MKLFSSTLLISVLGISKAANITGPHAIFVRDTLITLLKNRAGFGYDGLGYAFWLSADEYFDQGGNYGELCEALLNSQHTESIPQVGRPIFERVCPNFDLFFHQA